MIHIPHLETDITQACQLSCVACNHHVPLWRKYGPKTANSKQIEKDLGHLSAFLHADRWGALGGEPLLHRQLIDILKIVRDSSISDKTEVWTNGLLLTSMSKNFWKAFDILILSVYPGKHDDESLNWITAKCQDENVELVVKDERKHPNFKTLLEPKPTGFDATRSKFNGCFFKSFSRVANDGYFFMCCCAPHMPMLVQGRDFGDDGLLIKTATEDSLRAYLERIEPLGACSSCAGRDTAVAIPWSEERDVAKWLIASGVQV